jgi:hypothetical protein
MMSLCSSEWARFMMGDFDGFDGEALNMNKRLQW